MSIFATILQKPIFQFHRKIELNFDIRTTLVWQTLLPSRPVRRTLIKTFTWVGHDGHHQQIASSFAIEAHRLSDKSF